MGHSRQLRFRVRSEGIAVALALLLYLAEPRRARGEDFLDFKTLYYHEDNDRIDVISPAFYFQHDFSPTLSLRIDGIYNAISGASPTGAPPIPEIRVVGIVWSGQSRVVNVPPANPGGGGGGDDDDDENEFDGRLLSRGGYHTLSAATPAPPPPSPGGTVVVRGPVSVRAITEPTGGTLLQTAVVEEQRMGGNIELVKKIGSHAISGKLAFSTEHDYQSYGAALSDGIDFNDRNTLLTLGAAYTHDIIDARGAVGSGTKQTVDVIVGVNQLLDKQTRLTANVTLGVASGFMSDPYKVVELNRSYVSEVRPEEKIKEVAYLGIIRRVDWLSASVEGSYRFYNDSFGLSGHTVSLAWFQELGEELVLRPIVRFYSQDAADFYAVRFEGEPEFYSSDYRVSAFQALSYGLKLVWRPRTLFSVDAGYERYEQQGMDGETDKRLYPSAGVVTLGGRLWF